MSCREARIPGCCWRELTRDPRVESAQPLLSFETAANRYNDPYANLQKNVEEMAVPEAQ